jgi:prevent-host-death family protein
LTKLGASQARDAFADTLNRVAYRGERIVLRRRGKDLAAIVPMEDLKLIQEREDQVDVREAKKALAEMKGKGEKPIPYETVRKRLGLRSGTARENRAVGRGVPLRPRSRA